MAIDGEIVERVRDFIFFVFKITAEGDCSHEIQRCSLLERKAVTYLDSLLKRRDITLLRKVHIVKAMVFPIVMYGCGRWEGWALKNWCFWTVVLEKTFESPLECKEIKLVNPRRNQFGIFIGRTNAEAEALIFWPLHAESQPIGKDPDAGKDWRQ